MPHVDHNNPNAAAGGTPGAMIPFNFDQPAEQSATVPALAVMDGVVRANSRDVAKTFGKTHRDVLRAIDNLILQEPDLRLRNFAQTVVDRRNPSGGKSIPSRVFDMDRDGLSLLAMGFTGPKALRWKLKYIEAFNLMEAALREKASTFRARGGAPHVEIARECRLTMAQNLKMAKMMGLTGNQAALSANRATANLTGIDTLSLMGVTHMDAPQNEALLSPTDIAHRTGLRSAQEVNLELCALGLQHVFHDHKGRKYYEPTEAGVRAGGVMQDTGKKHDIGTPVRQLRWASSVIGLIERAG